LPSIYRGGVVVFIITEHSQKKRIKKFDSRNQNFIKLHLWIMMKPCILLTFFILSLSSCVQEPIDNSLVTPKYIKWEVGLPQDDDFIAIWDPIIHDNLIIFPVKDQGVLLALDEETGDEVWRWTEAKDSYEGADGFGEKSYIYDGVMVISQNNLTYGIDVETGKTLWHDRDEDFGLSFIYGYDDLFVRMFLVPDEKRIIKLGNVVTGEIVELYSYEREDSFAISSNIPMVFNHDGRDLLTFNKIKGLSNSEGYHHNAWVNLFDIYNMSLIWTSDTIPKDYSSDNTAGLRPIYHEGKLLMCSRSIFAYDVDSGELLWRDNSHGNTFEWNTHLTAADGKVFGNNENGYMIALDVETGSELWRTDTGGTGSRIEYYDHKVYINEITRAGMSYLMVLDANTGEVLHDIPSPYEIFGENNWYWDDVITVDQETGLIYTADHNKVMCIELDD